jgi:hypothetical protein
VDWSSRISVLVPIFHQPIVGKTFIGLAGTDDNIKTDLPGKRKEGISEHWVEHSGCITDSENLNT